MRGIRVRSRARLVAALLAIWTISSLAMPVAASKGCDVLVWELSYDYKISYKGDNYVVLGGDPAASLLSLFDRISEAVSVPDLARYQKLEAAKRELLSALEGAGLQVVDAWGLGSREPPILCLSVYGLTGEEVSELRRVASGIASKRGVNIVIIKALCPAPPERISRAGDEAVRRFDEVDSTIVVRRFFIENGTATVRWRENAEDALKELPELLRDYYANYVVSGEADFVIGLEFDVGGALSFHMRLDRAPSFDEVEELVKWLRDRVFRESDVPLLLVLKSSRAVGAKYVRLLPLPARGSGDGARSARAAVVRGLPPVVAAAVAALAAAFVVGVTAKVAGLRFQRC